MAKIIEHKKDPTMSDVQLLPELILEILSRLPVSSLLRFGFVFRPYGALIDSQYFVYRHLHQSIKSNTNRNLMLSGPHGLYNLDIDSPTKVFQKIESLGKGRSFVLGTCNGIICLYIPEFSSQTVIWNPCTRKLKKIPVNPSPFSLFFERCFYLEGFGYDKVNDDYKLMRLIQYCDSELVISYSKIEIYSLKSGSWRVAGDFPHYICSQRNNNRVFANGALHWLVSEKPNPSGDYLIASFDLTTEEYRLVPHPGFSKTDVKVSLDVLGGCLCMVCNYYEEKVDIWVMKSHGVKDAWTQLVSFVDVEVIKGLRFLRPLMYSKDGREVLLEKNHSRLFWYDLEKNKVREFEAVGMPKAFVADVYIGSLAQGNNDAKKKQVKEKKNNIKK